MKRLIIITALIGAMFNTQAAGWLFYAAAGKAMDPAEKLSYAVIPAFSANSGTPVVKFVDATCDNATNTVRFSTAELIGTVSVDTNSTNVIVVSGSTNVYCAAGDRVVIQHLANDTYWLSTLDSVRSTNSVVITNEYAGGFSVGDRVWKMSVAGNILVGAATKTVTGPCFCGQANRPLLVEATAASASRLNAVYVEYLKEP